MSTKGVIAVDEERKSNQQIVFDAIRSMTGQANILTIPRIFVDLVGDLETALFLSQVLYWSDKGSQDGGWFYKTYAEWEEEICLNEYKVRKAKNKLEEMGLIETKIKKANGNPTVHYRLKPKAFTDWFLKNLKKRTCENSSIEAANF